MKIEIDALSVEEGWVKANMEGLKGLTKLEHKKSCKGLIIST